MSRCDSCRYQNDFEFHACHICHMEKDMYKPKKTNADRIRAMSDEDLADFLRGFNGMCETHCPFGECGIHSLSCRDLAIKWLKQEAEDG